jgi:hypothetical protein
LLKAEDGTKDQSYFLYRLNQAQLSKTLFPLADIYKREVRKIAEAEGLHVAAKKDSTGICFIGERPFKDFLSRYLPPKQGEIRRLDDGKVMGEHDGLMFHTLGQRKGLHIGGLKEKRQPGGGDHDAWFVAGKDMEKNVLHVVQGHDHPALAQGAAGRRAAVLDFRAGAAHALGLHRQAALPDGRPALRGRARRWRNLRNQLRRAAVGADAGAVGGALREPRLPGRRGDPLIAARTTVQSSTFS